MIAFWISHLYTTAYPCLTGVTEFQIFKNLVFHFTFGKQAFRARPILWPNPYSATVSVRAGMSGNQPQLSELKLRGHGSMHMEEAKCSCGNVISKAVPSIKLNKKDSAAATGLIQDAGKGTLNIIRFWKKQNFLPFLSFFLFFSLQVPIIETHPNYFLCRASSVKYNVTLI